MKPKTKTFKNGATVLMDKLYDGMYCVVLRRPDGRNYDKISRYEYKEALHYYRAFKDIAKNL